jgi:hypothetical protein
VQVIAILSAISGTAGRIDTGEQKTDPEEPGWPGHDSPFRSLDPGGNIDGLHYRHC